MWVKLKVRKQIEDQGRHHNYQPGDWVNIGKQMAAQWIQKGEAEIPDQVQSGFVFEHAGIVTNFDINTTKTLLDEYRIDVAVSAGHPNLIYEKTLLWDPELPLPRTSIASGFLLLEKWDIVCPLFDYSVLAINVGTDEDREYAKSIVRDLRVPLYDHRMIFCKRNADTDRIIKEWSDLLSDGMNNQLSLLIAIYKVKPFILALPTTWTDNSAPR